MTDHHGGAAQIPGQPSFDEHKCICPHPAAQHDDGFGCTAEVGQGADRRPCPCLAGWSFA